MSGTFGVGRRVVVLGGRSDIARSIVEQMRRIDPAVSVVNCVRGAGAGEVEYDGAHPEAAERAVNEGAQRLGGVDCIIVAAGVLDTEGEDLSEPERVGRNATVNMAGACAAGAAGAKILAAHGGGTLVYLSSMAAVRPRGEMPVYSSAKQGADSFYRCAGRSWAEDGIVTLVIRPGFVRTKMTAGLKARGGVVEPATIGAVVVATMRRGGVGVHVVYSSPLLRAVAFIIRIVPQRLWARF